MTRVACPHCGIHNLPSAPHCSLCGARFQEAAGGPSTAPPGAAVAPDVRARVGVAPRAAGGRRDFYGEQRANLRRSRFLTLAVIILLSLMGWALGEVWGMRAYGWLGGLAAGGFTALLALFAGDHMILAASGAKEAGAEAFPQLHNVVEELCLASGLPKPRLYILESRAMNAFATGRDPRHAAIAVTRGLLEGLNREELQGVLAHEMSHIRNFDVRFALMVGILIGTVALLSDAVLRGPRRVTRRQVGRGGIALVILALAAAILAPLASRLIQMAISRRRELLADATAVELTRNPLGLASALRRIGGDREPLAAASRATQHMYIVNPLRAYGMDASALFSTHPPIEARVRVLEAMA